MSSMQTGQWPTQTAPQPPAPPPPGPPPASPPPDEPGSRIGLGMLLAILALAAVAAVLAAILIVRHQHRSASSTTVVVTTTATPAAKAAPASAKKASAKKLILPVPDLVGRPWKQASAGLRRAGFHVTFATVASALPRGAVTAQDPAPGTKVAKGSDVRLNVSDGSGAKSTPAAQPQQTTAAQRQQTTGASTTTEQTTTQAQAPPQPTTAQVPSLSGDLRSAVQALAGAGFLASVAYVPSTQPLGAVVAQSQSGGAKTGSQVTVNVSAGPGGNPEETVPNVVGRRIPQALATLHSAGLRLILLDTSVSDRSQAGVIVTQTPLPGKHAPKNAQVLVYLGAYKG
jgi:beta-lactam-binding protein with PASTA domain